MLKRPVNQVAVLARMVDKGDPGVGLAQMRNITSIQKSKRGYLVTIGVDLAWGERLSRTLEGEPVLVGGLMLADSETFAHYRAEMEAEQLQEEGETGP